MDYQAKLRELPVEHDFFIGIDSDGSVFDTMEIKQKLCFCPLFIDYFGFIEVAEQARETWEFVNLYSKTRGLNRFPALERTISLLAGRPEVKERNIVIPDTGSLQDWIKSASKHSNPALKQYAGKMSDPFLDLCLEWSEAVNSKIEETIHGFPPFPFVREVLDEIHGKADIIVVSQTPVEALEREWKEHDLERYPGIIAGQEYGTKKEHIKFAAGDKYNADRILLVGDAPGDLEAAIINGILFYPIVPGGEVDSWKNLYDEGIDRFLKGEYRGEYETGLIREFEESLPEDPPWK